VLFFQHLQINLHKRLNCLNIILQRIAVKLMEMTMDDMNESQAELEYEVTKIFEDLEEGTMLTISQIDTLRYVCGFPKTQG